MVSDKIRAALTLAGKQQKDLAEIYDTSTQAINNKMSLNRFTADDLIRIAEFTGCHLALIYPDGSQLVFTTDDIRQKEQTEG